MVRWFGVVAAVLTTASAAAQGLDARTQTQGLRVGTAFVSDWASDQELARTITQQYGFVTPTSDLDWDAPDDWRTWVTNATAWKLPFRGPRLAGGRVPARLGGLDAKALDRELTARVALLRQAGSPLSWDAAANVFTDTGRPADTVFARVWGADWPEHALRLVRALDAHTPLFLAEDNTLALNPRSDALYKLAAALKAKGVPLNGVALGSRQRAAYRADSLLVGANLQRFADLGLDIHLYDVEFGMEPGEMPKGRGVATPQSAGYDGLFRWILAVPAVKLVALAEPSDRKILSWPSGWTPENPSLFLASGLEKDMTLSLYQLLSGPRPKPEDLADAKARAEAPPVPGAAGPGLPLSWNGGDVWGTVPETAARGTPHHADKYWNLPDGKVPSAEDFSITWALTWWKGQLLLRVDRSDDTILTGNRGEAVAAEVRGPGYAASWHGVVGVDSADLGVQGVWSGGGTKLWVVFDVPADAGWGPGTTFFFRFWGTDADDTRSGTTVSSWPGSRDKLDFERLQIVAGQ